MYIGERYFFARNYSTSSVEPSIWAQKGKIGRNLLTYCTKAYCPRGSMWRNISAVIYILLKLCICLSDANRPCEAVGSADFWQLARVSSAIELRMGWCRLDTYFFPEVIYFSSYNVWRLIIVFTTFAILWCFFQHFFIHVYEKSIGAETANFFVGLLSRRFFL